MITYGIGHPKIGQVLQRPAPYRNFYPYHGLSDYLYPDNGNDDPPATDPSARPQANQNGNCESAIRKKKGKPQVYGTAGF
jgi:hypothetical protein